jgi:hypothetical protein
VSEDPIAKARATLAGPLAGPAEYGREALRVLVALYDLTAAASPVAAPVPHAPSPEPAAAPVPTPKRRPR